LWVIFSGKKIVKNFLPATTQGILMYVYLEHLSSNSYNPMAIILIIVISLHHGFELAKFKGGITTPKQSPVQLWQIQNYHVNKI
jgi:hypothetical protein